LSSLLPETSEPFELAIEGAHEPRWTSFDAAVPYIRTAKENPPPSFLPFLVWEFGLGMLTPYVPNLYEVIEQGLKWFRVRGTYGGVKKGLAFVGVSATTEPAWHGRAWWNSMPANDDPLLDRIEGITRLSLPFRSNLRRGVFEYDVGPALGDFACLDHCLLERESGVRLRHDGTVWSFGRTHEIAHVLTEAEGTAIGNWLDEPEGGVIAWKDVDLAWIDAHASWSDTPEQLRRSLLAAWFAGATLYATVRDEAGDVIGHRRCRAVWPCAAQFNGVYTFAGTRYQPNAAGTFVYIEAMTDFGDADGVTAARVEIAVGASVAAGVPPGRLWLAPDDLLGGVPIAATDISTPLRRTVRERFKVLLRF